MKIIIKKEDEWQNGVDGEPVKAPVTAEAAERAADFAAASLSAGTALG